MMRRVKGRRDDLPLNADINVTSLVDVAFTLLVIFIITAPALQGGLEIDVPEAPMQSLTNIDDPFFVSIERDGTIYLENTPVDVEEVMSSFDQLMAGRQVERVFLRADSLAPWAPILQVIGAFYTARVNYVLVGVPWIEN